MSIFIFTLATGILVWFLPALLGLIQKKSPHISIGLLIMTLTLFSTFGIIEIAIRTQQHISKSVPFWANAHDFEDKTLGWTGDHHFGDFNTKRKKVFIVGDSMTRGKEVPLKQRYFSLLQEKVDAEFFTYAASGYGTLQEELVLERYMRDINPDLVIIQVHPNDFINNSWELEKESVFNNKRKLRPYLIDGQIQYLFPRKHALLIKYVYHLSRYSRFFYFLVHRIDLLNVRLLQIQSKTSIETVIETEGLSHPAFLRSVATTKELFSRIKSTVGGKQLIVLSAANRNPYTDAFEQICMELQIPFITKVAESLSEKDRLGLSPFSADNMHWNALGHQAVADSLSDIISEYLK